MERDEAQGARNAGIETYHIDRRVFRVPRNTVIRSRRGSEVPYSQFTLKLVVREDASKSVLDIRADAVDAVSVFE